MSTKVKELFTSTVRGLSFFLYSTLKSLLEEQSLLSKHGGLLVKKIKQTGLY